MSKRFDKKFARRERDLYPTPALAVPPLIPHLGGIRTFAEPCCGDGALVRHLESYGFHCVYQGDICGGQDALKLTRADLNGADMICTNPPHARPLLHAMIQHFQALVPETWLLLPLDWTATKQAVPYLRTCTDIVNIGRVRWIAGTKWQGYDNYVWGRFDASHVGRTTLHPWKVAPIQPYAAEAGLE